MTEKLESFPVYQYSSVYLIPFFPLLPLFQILYLCSIWLLASLNEFNECLAMKNRQISEYLAEVVRLQFDCYGKYSLLTQFKPHFYPRRVLFWAQLAVALRRILMLRDVQTKLVFDNEQPVHKIYIVSHEFNKDIGWPSNQRMKTRGESKGEQEKEADWRTKTKFIASI